MLYSQEIFWGVLKLINLVKVNIINIRIKVRIVNYPLSGTKVTSVLRQGEALKPTSFVQRDSGKSVQGKQNKVKNDSVGSHNNLI